MGGISCSSFWFHTNLLGWWLPPNSGELWKKTPGLFPIFYSGNPSTRPTHQFLNYTEIWWNFRVGISLDEFPPHKIEMPPKNGPKIHYVKQNFARTHLVRISQILMNHWRVLKNTSASILHDRIPKQTSPVYTKIYLFVKRFLASGYFQIHPPQLSTCARKRCITNPSPPNSHLGFMDTALRREPGTWTPAMAPKCFNKNQKIEDIFIFPIGHVGRMDQVFASELFQVFLTHVFVPRLTISI